MLQPASFTSAPSSHDEPEDLPTVCADCDAELNGGWQVEELVYSRRDIEIVWFTRCPSCDGIVTK